MQLLLFRPKPLEDELLSSWLVRLAWANAQKLHPFCRKLFNGSKKHWYSDLDLSCNEHDLRLLSEATGLSIEKTRLTMLRSYNGYAFEALHTHGPMDWVMPIGKLTRTRVRHGQQYCPQCLNADEQPYFRRAWRLAFSVVCPKHHTVLMDACWQCGGTVSFHEGDYGRRYLSRVCPLVYCRHCGVDLRCHHAPPASTEMVMFQNRLNAALFDGYHHELPGAATYSVLMFAGLHRIVRMLVSRGQAGRLRSFLQHEAGSLAMHSVSGRGRFEELRLGDRYHVLQLAQELFPEWPTRFIDACRRARVSSAYIHDHKASLPFWLHKPVYWYLYDRYYAPTAAERMAVTAFLERRGIQPAANTVKRWLGVAHNESGTPATLLPPKKHWNSRQRTPNR